MKILYYLEPLYQLASPAFKRGWVEHFAALQIESLAAAGGFEFALAVNRALAPFVPEGRRKLVFSQAELLGIFNYARTGDELLYAFHRESLEPGFLPAGELAAYAGAVRAKAGDFQPDLVVSCTPAPWIRPAFPDAVPLFLEYGFTTRVPFPESWYFDSGGIGAGYGWQAREAAAGILAGPPLAPDQKERLNAYKREVRRLIEERNPFRSLIGRAKGKFRKLALLALSGPLPYLYRVFAESRDHFHTIMALSAALPPDWGLAVFKHPNDVDLIKPEAMEELGREFPNLIYDRSFEHVLSAAQYWYEAADLIVSGYSACSLHSLIWDKPLVSLARGHAEALAVGHGEDLPGVLERAGPDRDAFLHWLLTRYYLPDFLIKSPEWFAGFIRGFHRRLKEGAIPPASLYEPFQTDEAEFFKSLTAALNPEIPQTNHGLSLFRMEKLLYEEREKREEVAAKLAEEREKREDVAAKLAAAKTELTFARAELAAAKAELTAMGNPDEGRGRDKGELGKSGPKPGGSWEKRDWSQAGLPGRIREKAIAVSRLFGGSKKSAKAAIVCSNICGRRGLDVKRLESYLRANDYEVEFEAEKGDLLLFLGCAFNRSCEETSLESLRRLALRFKKVFVLEGIGMTVSPENLRRAAGKKIAVIPLDRMEELDCHFFRKKRWPDIGEENRSHIHGEDGMWDVQVGHGCRDRCSYCGDKMVVGDLRSKPLPAIVEECRRGLGQGYRKIRLLGDDVGAAGLDRDYGLVDLLDQVTALPGLDSLSLEEINIKYLILNLDRLGPLLSRNVLKYLALAFQHVSDEILGRMERGYTGQELDALVVLLIRAGVTLRFHAIIAFPGETVVQLRELLDFIIRCRLPAGSIFIFQVRPYAPAASFKGQFTEAEIKGKIAFVSSYLGESGYRVEPHCLKPGDLPDKLWVEAG
ncbi:MAG: radical SAM protein [Planctomycetota bacterium]|nr:radical SAM protein [Planctomycetota bacterium]